MEGIREIFTQITWRDLIDILIVAFLFYKLTLLIRGTRAIQLLKGLFILLAAMVLSDWLGLRTVNWILSEGMIVGIVAIPIVFQPELRRALEHLGRGRFFGDTLFTKSDESEERQAAISEIKKAVKVLQTRKMGALLVIERETGLKDIIESGIKINGDVSAELLINIFVPLSPLHDGAVIIRDGQVAAAGCYLPLTEQSDLDKELGTRHRAALGISENSDAICVIVSEETGAISLTEGDNLSRFLDEDELEELLEKFWHQPESHGPFWQWRFGN